MKISAMILSWNTKEETIKVIKAIHREMQYFRRNGHECCFVFTDNGSSDGIVEWVEKNGDIYGITHKNFNPFNFGISLGRNIGLDQVYDSDYIFMIDGDIKPVKNSFRLMVEYMEENPDVGCFGACSSQTAGNEIQATQSVSKFNKIEDGHIGGLHGGLAYTQYGCFRGNLFGELGFRFEIGGPYALPGHGYEDDDMAFQITKIAKMKIMQTKDMEYYHKKWSVSIDYLKKEHNTNFNDRAILEQERINYLIEKWKLKLPIRSIPNEEECDWGQFWNGDSNIQPLDSFRLEIYNSLKRYDFNSLFSVGFGSASVEYYLLNRDAKKIGLCDTNRKAIEAAKKVFNGMGVEIFHNKVEDCVVPEKYDMVYSCGLLEHFNSEENIINILKGKKNISKKYVISIVPNARCLPYVYGKYWSERLGEWEYGLEIPKRSQKIYFERAGIEVIDEFDIDKNTGMNFLCRVPEKYRHPTYESQDYGYLLVTVGVVK